MTLHNNISNNNKKKVILFNQIHVENNGSSRY